MAAKSCRISQKNNPGFIAPEVGRGFSRDQKRGSVRSALTSGRVLAFARLLEFIARLPPRKLREFGRLPAEGKAEFGHNGVAGKVHFRTVLIRRLMVSVRDVIFLLVLTPGKVVPLKQRTFI